ncbi:MAG: hypothetical protein AAF489_03650 [Bacteroidota bacterium]
MDAEKITDHVNKQFLEKRDARVSKPDIWVCKEETRKYMVWPANWVIEADKVAIMMDRPHDVALYSSIAGRSLNEARALYKEKIFPFGKIYPLRTIEVDEQRDVYNYLEHIITAVIMSYTALEAFANSMIPDQYTVKVEESTGIVKIWNKHAIEKTYKLRDKLKKVLSECLKTSDPTTEGWWPRFIELEDLRNEIVHAKTANSEQRYSLLLNEKVFQLVECHYDALAFYGHRIEKLETDAINLFPYGYGSDTVKPNLISEEEFDRTHREINNINL